MSFLMAGAERYALKVGCNVLGGTATDAVAVPGFATLEPAAALTVDAEASATIVRLASSLRVCVDGEPLDAAPVVLRHGARLQVDRLHLTYGADERAVDGTGRAGTAEPHTDLVPAFEARAGRAAHSPADGHLVELRTGRVFAIPTSGLVFGRSPACDVVLLSGGVSRRHAVVRRDSGRCTVTDESANGTYLNGTRVASRQELASGDVLRVGDDAFRYEVGPAAPRADCHRATEVMTAVAEPRGAARVAERTAPPLATLEVTRGALAGTRFPIDRPVCALGRAEHNDVRLPDGSVSAAHATLLRKAGAWYAVDLRSANGTYVDGYRVGAERVLSGACTLRVGDVHLRFRPTVGAPETWNNERRPTGLLARLRRLW